MKFNPRSIFSEIASGYSLIYWRGQSIYFSHFNNCQLGSFSLEEERIYEHAHNEGLQTEEEKIDQLKKDGSWTEANERELRQEREFLDNQITTKKNLLLDSQVVQVNKVINESQEKINKILSARAVLVGYTVENFVARKMNERHIFYSTFKDSELKISLFTIAEFDELEDDALEELIILYNNRLDYLNKNIKKLAISPFFQNLFHLSSENIYGFYGKPVINLSLFSLDLFVYARFFMNILSGEAKPTEEMMNNPELLIESHQKNTNLKGALKDSQADLSGGGVVGASVEEMKAAGIEGRKVNFRKRLKDGESELDATTLATIFNS